MSEERDPSQTIKVTDRRSFTKDGQRRDADSEPTVVAGPAKPAAPDGAKTLQGEGFTMAHPAPIETDAAAQDAAFLNLVVSIYQSGCIHLGLAGDAAEAEDAEGAGAGPEGQEPVDFAAARGTIEMLLAIKKKTAGNLATEESRILETLLAELQMAYALKVADT